MIKASHVDIKLNFNIVNCYYTIFPEQLEIMETNEKKPKRPRISVSRSADDSDAATHDTQRFERVNYTRPSSDSTEGNSDGSHAYQPRPYGNQQQGGYNRYNNNRQSGYNNNRQGGYNNQQNGGIAVTTINKAAITTIVPTTVTVMATMTARIISRQMLPMAKHRL